MDVSLAKQYVRLAADLYFATVLRIKQDSISDLNRADVCSSCDHSCPRQPSPHLRRRRDHDASRRAPLTRVGVNCHQNPVMQHPDRQLFEVLLGVTHNNERTNRGRMLVALAAPPDDERDTDQEDCASGQDLGPGFSR
jgi:hypothetical protein